MAINYFDNKSHNSNGDPTAFWIYCTSNSGEPSINYTLFVCFGLLKHYLLQDHKQCSLKCLFHGVSDCWISTLAANNKSGWWTLVASFLSLFIDRKLKLKSMTSRLTFLNTEPNYTNDRYAMRSFQTNYFCMPSRAGIKTLYDSAYT